MKRKGHEIEALAILVNKALDYNEKYDKLESLLQPLLWRKEDIRLALTTKARKLCEARIGEYIESLWEYVTFEGIESINQVEIDKSETGLTFAAPRKFTISMDDLEFVDRTYNITAEYNRANNADKGKKRAYEKYSRLIGDEWDTSELRAQGYTPQQIINYCKYGWIEEVQEKKKGNLKYYRRILR